jgi:hypothetical protein
MANSLSKYMVLILIALSGIACKEDLPPYISPVNPLAAEVHVELPSLITYSHLDVNNVNTTRVTITTSLPVINIGLTNVSDETVEDVEGINGTLELWCTDHPDIIVTIPLNATTINSPYFDPDTKIITLDPGKTFWLKTYWNLKLDDLTWVFTKLKIANDQQTGNSGNFIRTHTPTVFSARATVQMFSKLAPSKSSITTFTLAMQGSIIAPP